MAGQGWPVSFAWFDAVAHHRWQVQQPGEARRVLIMDAGVTDALPAVRIRSRGTRNARSVRRQARHCRYRRAGSDR